MESLKDQFFEVLKNNNEEEIKNFVNKPQNGMGISFIEYLCYIEDVDTLKEIIKYAEFDKNRGFCNVLNAMIGCYDIQYECGRGFFNKKTYIEDTKKILDCFEKTISNEEVELINAIMKDDVNTVKRIINDNPQFIKKRYTFEDTLLIIAVKNNSIESAITLIDAGANILVCNCAYKSPLDFAAENGCLEVINKIIDKRISINSNFRAKTPLASAAKNGHLDIVKTLIEHGADLELTTDCNFRRFELPTGGLVSFDSEGKPLELAAENGHLDIVNTLLEAGAEVYGWGNFDTEELKDDEENDSYSDSYSDCGCNFKELLLLAAANGHKDVIDRLIEISKNYNNEINKKINSNECKFIYLICAIANNDIDTVNKILKSNPNITKLRGREQKTALIYAIENNNIAIVNRLLEIDPDIIKLRGKYEKTALTYAIGNDNIDIANKLIEIDPNIVNLREDDLTTTLMYAASNCDINVIKVLIEAGADINAIDDRGYSALTYAAMSKGQLETLKFLIKHGVNNDLINPTLLLKAAKVNDLETVKFLVDEYNFDATENMKDYFKIINPFMGSIRSRVADSIFSLEKLRYPCGCEVFDFFLKKYGNPNIGSDNNNCTLLMESIEKRNFVIFNELIESGADINAVNKFGFTALMYTIMHDYCDTEFFNTLIKHSADVTIQDNNGQTALMHIARSGEHIEFIDTLVTIHNNVNVLDKEGYSTLFYALDYNKFDVAEKLIELGADINIVDQNGYDILMHLINKELIRQLNKGLQSVSTVYLNKYIDFLESHNFVAHVDNKIMYEALITAVTENNKNFIDFLQRQGLTIDKINFDDEQTKKRISELFSKQGFPVTINDISNVNKNFVTKAIKIVNNYFGRKIILGFYKLGNPMKDFIICAINFTKNSLTREERYNLKNIAVRFDNAIINRNQREIKNSINDLFILCRANENIYNIIDNVIDRDIIYENNNYSLTKLLNFYGFDTEVFCAGMRTNQILANGIKGVSVLNAKMDDENQTKMSIINKYFLLVYKIIFSEEIYALSQNKDINNACFLYQQYPTEKNKNNLINIIINNSDHETKETLLSNLIAFEAKINRFEDLDKVVKLETLLNGIVVSDFGTCLKNRLERELGLSNDINDNQQQNLNNLENANNDLNNNQNQDNLNNNFEDSLVFKDFF